MEWIDPREKCRLSHVGVDEDVLMSRLYIKMHEICYWFWNSDEKSLDPFGF
jgi:hypothetical protein